MKKKETKLAKENLETILDRASDQNTESWHKTYTRVHTNKLRWNPDMLLLWVLGGMEPAARLCKPWSDLDHHSIEATNVWVLVDLAANITFLRNKKKKKKGGS